MGFENLVRSMILLFSLNSLELFVASCNPFSLVLLHQCIPANFKADVDFSVCGMNLVHASGLCESRVMSLPIVPRGTAH